MKRRAGPGGGADARDSDGLTPEDRRIWSRVAGSVTPHRRRKAVRAQADAAHVDVMAQVLAGLDSKPSAKRRPAPAKTGLVKTASAKPAAGAPPARAAAPPEDVEPNRRRRLTRERDPIEARIDLHGFGRFEAEDQLRAFLTACQARGMRAVLVITGQGRMGGGVIRAAFADWMHSPSLRSVVSGYAVAHQRHGGAGAFYVTLRRRV